MDWLTFISKIVEALAWPGVIALVVILFRSKLADLVPRLQQFKYKELEVLFNTIQKQTEEEEVRKLEIKQRLETVDLPPQERAEATAQFEEAVKAVTRLEEQRRLLISKLNLNRGELGGREAILRTIASEIVAHERVGALTQRELIAGFRHVKRAIELGVHPSLNGGALTGLRFAGILDSSNDLTNVGAELLMNTARQISHEREKAT